ncbi:MAG: type I restriction enzyme HsdR N-terminal domain-containing protein [Bacteroidota bacterium]
MSPLNLPPAELRLKEEDGHTYVFDPIRKKHLVLTPEEWVRQHWLHYLTGALKYPKGLIKAEGGLRWNKLQKRTDIVCHGPEGKPLMLIECKSPYIKITDAVFRQASLYNRTIGARCLVLSNGLVHFCAIADEVHGTMRLIKEVPAYAELCGMQEGLGLGL